MREHSAGRGAGVIEVPVDGVFDEASAEQADLVGLQIGGARPPLFLIRTWTGEVASYRRLARHLGPDQPIYAFAPPRGTRLEDFPNDVQAWAELVLSRLLEIPHPGPYFIGGWSFGGVIAYEVAQHLVRSGRKVDLLALLDTRMPTPRPKRRRGSTRRGAIHKSVRNLDRLLEQQGWRARLAYLRGRARRRREKLTARAQRVGEWWRSDAAAALPARAESAGADAMFVTPTGRRISLLRRTIWVSYRKYRPTSSALPVLLLRTAESQAAAGDASLGWGPCLTGDFECRLVPGKHFTIFDEPLVAALAQRLSAALERASSGPARSDR